MPPVLLPPTMSRDAHHRAGLAAVLGLLGSCVIARAPAPEPALEPRHILELDRGWRFHLGVTAGQQPELDDRGWTAIDLPHTWNAVDGQDGGDDYRRDVGWYRLRLRIPPSAAGQRLFLEIDGAATVADVYLNGQHAGRHAGAYARFRVDVTRHARIGDNLLAIAVDNRDAPAVAPLRGADFTYFGGLYRGARLLVTGALHVDALDHGGPGVALRQRVSQGAAEVVVETAVVNDGAARTETTVETVLYDGARVVGRAKSLATIPPGGRTIVSPRLHIRRPRLWEPHHPHLYRVEVSVLDGGRVTDRVSQPLGLRFFDFDPARGFSLNGGPYRQLRGVGLHQDWQGRGPAATPAQRRQNLALVRALGADSVRLTHYQHAPDTYDEADRLGLLVWTEVPVINRIAGTPEFAASARQQLAELIVQNQNHPSVVMWGIANEPVLHAGPDPLPLLGELHALAHRLDPSRPTVLASHMAEERGPDTHPTHQVTDLLAFNAYHGWYYGRLDDLEPWIAGYHRNHPGRAIALSEFGAGAGIDRHAERPSARDLSEEYQALFLDRHLAAAARSPLWGAFVWVLADFAADHRTDGFRPGINDKGLVTYDRGVRKDAFYVVRAHWSRSPTLRIASRRFREREAPAVEVAVISNLERVDLWVNGARMPEAAPAPGSRILRWRDVPLRAGDNEIVATARGPNGREMVDRVRWRRSEWRAEPDRGAR